MFLINVDRMKEAGVLRMSYAWFDPRYKVCNPVDQAHSVILLLSKRQAGLASSVR